MKSPITYLRDEISSYTGLNKWSILYIVTMITIHSIFIYFLTIAALRNEIKFYSIWFLYGVIVGIPIAERISQAILFLIAQNNATPPRLEKLRSSPRVALLYCTCDDAALMNLELLVNQTYNNISIFILDDSHQGYYKKLVDSSGYNVIRRGNRIGYKAGNLNNWLHNWGSNYEYFVILDADSILNPDFVEKMLQYSEHPDNYNIAMFESMIHVWTPSNIFQNAQAVQLKMASVASIRLNNRLNTTLSNGHNNLCRTSAILAIGGFDERFISEDHATTLNLFANNLACRVVKVISYESVPSTLFSYKQRSHRWVRNDFQLLNHSWKNVPLALQLKILLHIILHSLWIPAIIFVLPIIWANNSSFIHFQQVLDFLIWQGGFRHPQIAPTIGILFIYLSYLFLTPIPLAIAARIGFFQYIRSALVTFCLGFGSMFSIIRGVIDTLSGVPFPFVVTPKNENGVNFKNFVKENLLLFFLVLIVFIGIMQNPIIIVFNWTWIIPLIASPFIIYYSQIK